MHNNFEIKRIGLLSVAAHAWRLGEKWLLHHAIACCIREIVIYLDIIWNRKDN